MIQRLIRRVCIFFLIIGLLAAANIFAADKVSLDPTDISLGGRSLGLGRSYSSRLNDPHGMFLNPAGLGSFSNNTLTSTGTQMLGEVYRFYGGGTFRLDSHTSWGLGAVYSNESGGNFRDINNSALGPAINFTDLVLLGGIGTRTGFPFSSSRKRNWYFGTTLKYFYKNFSGVTGGSSGFNMDVGMVYRVNTSLRLGLHAKNIANWTLQSFGSSLTEAPEQKIIGGFEWELFGKDRFFDFPGQTLTLSMDGVFANSSPTLLRSGLEWSPMQNLSLRGGLYTEQESALSSTNLVNTGVVNSYVTLGMGYKLDNFTFNYAYQPNDQFIGSNHFMTLTIYEPVALRAGWMLNQPKDKTITYLDNIDFIGKLVRDEGYVLVNGQEVQVSANLSFIRNMPLKLGRNKFVVEYYNDEEELIERKIIRILRLKQFVDIPKDFYVRKTIEEIGTLTLISTANQKLFEPNYEVERKEFVAYLLELYKLAEIQAEPRQAVASVQTEDEFNEFLIQKNVHKFVIGYPDGYLKPNIKATRAEGASLFLRFHEYSNKKIDAPSLKSFKDIKTDHWAAGMIAKAREAGLIHGGDLQNFNPGNPMKKVEMALMMARTRFVKKQIEALYDWDKY